MIFNTKINMLYLNIMYAEIMKSTSVRKNMTAIFYDDDKVPIKTVHVGAETYDDHTEAPRKIR